ncbi:SOS response-associated peptidase [Sphingomonas sp. NIBR02145]|uniref:SOS response-associated peptidase family protein n=1 Tax=Sphingomonas sp. NIBR02145 TaxID=3014784 RepID=UPI0022B5E2D6|nr:SOS response-associated peptidase [Sphingomonas sp. NIBR02145]WHU04398.1 SOS response-associated peptidase [Sphingomonas sp. NIBR02145]
MCNDYRHEVDIASIMEDFDELEIAIDTPEGTPNVAAREDIKITDIAPIVASVAGARARGALLNRRWSWPGPTGKPVYNYRAESREFQSNRCLILTDGFYKFTKAKDPKQKRQNKWLFTLEEHDWFAIAGIWRKHPEVGEAFTMLTLDAGSDVAPYHHRQIIPLARDQWSAWLDPAIPAADILRILPPGSLKVRQVHGAPPGVDSSLLL